MALYANGSVGRFLIGEEITESAISAGSGERWRKRLIHQRNRDAVSKRFVGTLFI